MKKTIYSTVLLAFLLVSSNQLVAQSYNSDLEYRKWRITLFPPLSTNGVAAKNYTAKYSINIIGGYHGGLNGLEIGTLFNYNKHYASGFQIVGGVNATGGPMEGVNIAGLLNQASSNISGIQIAGLANISGSGIEGIQVAGGVNASNADISGLQAAGIGNISGDDIEGLQGASAFNISRGNLSGAQGTLGANIALGDVEGLQISGVLNFAQDDISGLQITGGGNIGMEDLEGLMISSLFNVAKEDASGLLITGGLNYSKFQEGLMIGGANVTGELNGLQIAGLLNYAHTAEGVQFGLINIAKEFEGVPVGLISLYGNGRKNFDVRYSDGGFTDIGINLGTYRVYNMAILGYNTSLDRNVYRLGLAVGLEKHINDSFEKIDDNSLFVNQEFSVVHHFEEKWTKKTNLIYAYKFLVGKRFNSGMSLYAGPSFNAQITRVNEANDYTWYSLWSPDAKGRQYRFWVGFTGGIRLFKQKELPRFDDDFDFDW
ncbi:hypothetical protein [Balneola vulgaris]|uniref:hypothetical protein n=1 Tax=Balneola vulgaris TaxID=287535 RepID=UPI00037FB1A6|nr:hypothetical protein [Balneola vulgaris]